MRIKKRFYVVRSRPVKKEVQVVSQQSKESKDNWSFHQNIYHSYQERFRHLKIYLNYDSAIYLI